MLPDDGLQGPWTIDICPICGGQAKQLAHGRCARECRDEHGVIPAMVTVSVVRAPPDRDELVESAAFVLWSDYGDHSRLEAQAEAEAVLRSVGLIA